VIVATLCCTTPAFSVTWVVMVDSQSSMGGRAWSRTLAWTARITTSSTANDSRGRIRLNDGTHK
jgi:hypothetical protein